MQVCEDSQLLAACFMHCTANKPLFYLLQKSKMEDLYANPFKYDLNKVVRKENKAILWIFKTFLFRYLFENTYRWVDYFMQLSSVVATVQLHVQRANVQQHPLNVLKQSTLELTKVIKEKNWHSNFQVYGCRRKSYYLHASAVIFRNA